MASHDKGRSDFRHDRRGQKKEQNKKYKGGQSRERNQKFLDSIRDQGEARKRKMQKTKPAIIEGAFDKPSCCKGKNEKSQRNR